MRGWADAKKKRSDISSQLENALVQKSASLNPINACVESVIIGRWDQDRRALIDMTRDVT